MASFLANEEYFDERPIGGRPYVERGVHSLEDLVYTFRWENRAATCDGQVTWQLGTSAVVGPNTTGGEGNTQILGVDLTRRRAPSEDEHAWPFTLWTSEFMVRRYAADRYTDLDGAQPGQGTILPSETLWDWGFYTQLLRGFRPHWAWGIRYEYVSGSGASLDAALQPINRNQDPFRDDRHRVSPLVSYLPSEFLRIRFQYNFDHAMHLPSKTAHSFWLSAEFILGAHPARPDLTGQGQGLKPVSATRPGSPAAGLVGRPPRRPAGGRRRVGRSGPASDAGPGSRRPSGPQRPARCGP